MDTHAPTTGAVPRAPASKSDVLTALASWKDFWGCTPFGGANSHHATDRCSRLLANAGAILSMLSAANEDSATLLRKGQDSSFDNRVGTIMAGALEGVGDLINLASFMLQEGE